MSMDLAEHFRAAIFAETNNFTVGVRKINGVRFRAVVDSIQQLQSLAGDNNPEAKEMLDFLAGTPRTKTSLGRERLSLPISDRPNPQSSIVKGLIENIFPNYGKEMKRGQRYSNEDQLTANAIIPRIFNSEKLEIDLPVELRDQVVEVAKNNVVVITAEQAPAIFAKGPA